MKEILEEARKTGDFYIVGKPKDAADADDCYLGVLRLRRETKTEICTSTLDEKQFFYFNKDLKLLRGPFGWTVRFLTREDYITTLAKVCQENIQQMEHDIAIQKIVLADVLAGNLKRDYSKLVSDVPESGKVH